MNHQKENQVRRLRRRLRVRKPLKGQVGRPRLSVFRSHKHISAQIIDDIAGTTLCAASTTEAELKSAGYGGNAEAAAKIGKLLAERALAKGITKILFDRREYRYHGRVAALATAAREGGLQF